MHKDLIARKRMLAVTVALLFAGSLVGCGGDSDGDSAASPDTSADSGIDNSVAQPTVSARTKSILTVGDKKFKDLNGNGSLDKYEDWRRTADDRAADLVSKMTLEEKAGMLLINTLNSDCSGAVPQTAFDYINTQKMTRFILRNSVVAAPTCTSSGGAVTPQNMAKFTNAIQAMSESTRLGIPSLFKSNARNHYDKDPRVGINEGTGGAFTEFPKEPGLAAAALGGGDMTVIKDFATVMGNEWKAIGLRGMYGYMADLSTEPRWNRVHETFTEDSDLATNIITTLVQTLQGPTVKDGSSLTPNSAVALTLKHFPGHGPQNQGLDSHMSFGKYQVFPGKNFAAHVKPFKAAIDAGVASIMPNYSIITDTTYDGITFERVGSSFSKSVVTDLLRNKLGFKGYVNSDTGIIEDRPWGMEKATVAERIAKSVNVGVEVLSGYSTNKTVTDLVKAGLVSESRINEAVKLMLKEQFKLGLFENPYVDDTKANAAVGSDANRAVGQDIQRKSLVLLQNQDTGTGVKALPLKAAGAKVYTMGISDEDVAKYGFAQVTNGANSAAGSALPTDANGSVIGRRTAAGSDYAIIRVEITANKLVAGTTTTYRGTYKSDSVDTGLNPSYVNPVTGKPYGSEDRCVAKTAMYSDVDAAKSCLDNGIGFGGAVPWETHMLALSDMNTSKSWLISPSLTDIQAVMNEVGAKNTIITINFRQPWVLDQASGILNAGAIVGNFGVGNTALLDVLTGKVAATGASVKPQGKLPYALAKTSQAIADNQADMPGYPEKDTLFKFGFGLTY